MGHAKDIEVIHAGIQDRLPYSQTGYTGCYFLVTVKNTDPRTHCQKALALTSCNNKLN